MTSVAISLGLIPTIGMVGAGIAFTAPTLVIALLSVFYLRSQKISPQLSSMGRPLIFILTSMVFGFLSARFIGIAPALTVTLLLYSFAVLRLGGLRSEDFELIRQMTKGRVSLNWLNRMSRYVGLRSNEGSVALHRTTCPTCGGSIDKSDSLVRFCPRCGARLASTGKK